MARPRKQRQAGWHGTRAVIYLRVSKEDGRTKDGKVKNGLDVQRDAAQAYAESKGYTLVATKQDDGVSGAVRLSDRQGLQEAFKLCEDGKADVIIAYHQDRLARKTGVFDEIRDEAIRRGIRLETADGRVLTQKEDFTNGDVMALVAAIERRRISERFYEARKRRSKQDGLGSGPIPYGYRLRVITDEMGAIIERHILIAQDTVPTITRLFALRDGGATYQLTADTLNREGYRAPKGGGWTVGQVQAIERHRELYATGTRRWDGVVAAQLWPVVLREEIDSTRS